MNTVDSRSGSSQSSAFPRNNQLWRKTSSKKLGERRKELCRVSARTASVLEISRRGASKFIRDQTKTGNSFSYLLSSATLPSIQNCRLKFILSCNWLIERLLIMSYSFLFKYIIIGDTGRFCWHILPKFWQELWRRKWTQLESTSCRFVHQLARVLYPPLTMINVFVRKKCLLACAGP